MGFRNASIDDGKFQCRFENDSYNGEVDLFRILILFIIFEVEVIFLIIALCGVIFVVVVIMVVMILELFREMV